MTIFLNPLQFGPKEDLSRYPRTFDADLEICTAGRRRRGLRADPRRRLPRRRPGRARLRRARSATCSRAQSRPGHFDGMLTVVGKLLHLTAARSAYFGQKDAQQLLLIRRMVRDLDFPVDVVVGADRARARRAGDEQPQHVPHRVRPRDRPVPVAGRCGPAATAAAEGPSAIRRAAREVLVREPLALVDYLVLVHPHTLEDVPEWYRGEALLAVAARVGTTRLIDNLPVLVGPGGGALDVFSDVPHARAEVEPPGCRRARSRAAAAARARARLDDHRRRHRRRAPASPG